MKKQFYKTILTFMILIPMIALDSGLLYAAFMVERRFFIILFSILFTFATFSTIIIAAVFKKINKAGKDG